MDCLVDKAVQLDMENENEEDKELENISAAVQSFLDNGKK